jgi:hypothetical protein
MIHALSFVYSDGKEEKRQRFLSYSEKLHKIIDENYRNLEGGTGYSFPFQHFFIKTIKS